MRLMRPIQLKIALLATVNLGGLLPLATAQLPDPTRPPTGGVVVTTPTVAGEAAAPEGANTVQAVFVRPGGKSTAIINGQTVRVGDMLGDKKVKRITDKEIVLQGDSGRDTLSIYPGIEKSMIKTKPSQAAEANKGRESR